MISRSATAIGQLVLEEMERQNLSLADMLRRIQHSDLPNGARHEPPLDEDNHERRSFRPYILVQTASALHPRGISAVEYERLRHIPIPKTVRSKLLDDQITWISRTIVEHFICSCGIIGKGIDRVSVGIGMVPRGEGGLIFANIGLALSV